MIDYFNGALTFLDESELIELKMAIGLYHLSLCSNIEFDLEMYRPIVRIMLNFYWEIDS
jgi:hypothetical protein